MSVTLFQVLYKALGGKSVTECDAVSSIVGVGCNAP